MLITYGRKAFIPVKHNDIIELAEDQQTYSIRKIGEMLEKHNIVSYRYKFYEDLKEWKDQIIRKVEKSSITEAYERTKNFKTMKLFWSLKNNKYM